MTRKQIIGAGAVIVAVLLWAVFVRMAGKPASQGNQGEILSTEPTPVSQEKHVAPPVQPAVPDTIDGATQEISSEANSDSSAFDEEESGAVDQVNQDTNSVNNFDSTYDENKL